MAPAVSTRARRRAVLPAVLLVPLLLTACGGGHEGHGSSEPVGAASDAPASAGYNDHDVMFLQMMIAHHKQGVEMARVAAERAQGTKVRNLAAAVAATQSEEVKTMSSWLRTWSKPLTSDHPAGAHAAHGGMPATGAKEIRTLKQTTGAGFEPAFLNLFVGHQHGAVEMADTELSKGGNADAKAFAKRVKESRTDQIRQMLGLLNG
ncbi:DUF305 domain-containing protein [Actinomadura sp. 7K507]|uniref:DUF305 domain-containing protein n=1 Tax=Actinomadura sp. 7K507 TaxID=2530365 RepID=UPI0010486559|nr:DUF305 domain-containing protein [Actinomadura sp. 7K507]TDC94227.1 DUF305 domain-containing protein [Actinomadura sp. 7K507]